MRTKLTALSFFFLLFFPVAVFADMGDVWLNPSSFTLGANESFNVQVFADTGSAELGSFDLYLDFSYNDVTVDMDEGNNGITLGSNATNYEIESNGDDISNGHYRFAGICAQDCASGDNVHLITIHMKTRSSFTSGSSQLSLRINTLSNTLGSSIASGDTAGTTVNSNSSDTTPPSVSSPSPSGTLSSGTNSTTLSVSTDESSTCKYSTNSGVAYSSMTNTFTTTGGTSHYVTVNGLSNGESYDYYVKCTDTSGNVNTTDTHISFSVANSGASPTCTSFTYTVWGECGSNSRQTRTVLTSSPSGCAGGSPITSRSCTYSGDSSGGGSSSSSGGGSSKDNANTKNTTNSSKGNTASAKKTFTKFIKLGATDNEVLILQQTLNSLGYVVSSTGLGSPGNETAYFGKKTLRALNAFQRAHNLPVTSYLDIATRNALNSLNTKSTTNKIKTTVTSFTWNRNLSVGSRGSDVLNLQKVLINEGYLKLDSPTTYFGPLTRSALIRYQRANGITPAVGYFGPLTRKHINASNTSTSYSSNKKGELSLKEVINLFLALGIIPESKKDVALSTLNSLE
jgi:peptidoglycan hydrolase-like protein with peptidoglycan-binding domain